MRNVALVIKHEILTTLGKPSFWLTAFAVPLLIFAISFGSQALATRVATDEAAAESDLGAFLVGTDDSANKPVGYVDESGVITRLPDDLGVTLRLYDDVAQAEAGLSADEIDRYYVIPADVVEIGKMSVVQDAFSPFEAMGSGNPFEYVLAYNLSDNPDAASLIVRPMPSVLVERVATGEDDVTHGSAQVMQTFVPVLMLFVFFITITMTSGYMLSSVSKEKTNRIVEVLLLSMRPRELMLGKMLGLGVVALLQMGVWLAGSLLTLDSGLPALGVTAVSLASLLPPGFVAWALLFFVLGYMVYAAALGALGALMPATREGSQFTFIVLLPLMVPMMLNQTFATAPGGALVTAFSLFPLTAPVSMVTRMVAVDVPVWQSVLSLALLAATAYGFVLLAARFFRSDTLLSNSPLDMARLKSELLGRLRV